MDMEPKKDMQSEINTEPKEKRNRLPSKTMLIVRFVVAAYLMYLSYDIAHGYFNAAPDKTTTMPAWAMITFVTLFCVVGAVVCIITVIELIKGRYRGGKGDK